MLSKIIGNSEVKKGKKKKGTPKQDNKKSEKRVRRVSEIRRRLRRPSPLSHGAFIPLF
jgi:hypothetical protein